MNQNLLPPYFRTFEFREKLETEEERDRKRLKAGEMRQREELEENIWHINNIDTIYKIGN